MKKATSFFGSNTDKNFGIRDKGHKLAVSDAPFDARLEGTQLDRTAKRIELGRIIAKEQVRTNFDETELNELAHSLKTLGQKQPILVYWREAEDRYVIIAGERRFRAAKIAGLEALDCKIHPNQPDEAELVELQFVENAIRTDLNAIEEAISYKRLKELKSMSANELAKRIGKAQSTVSRSLSLLKLPENIQQHIAKGEIPTSVAREMVKLKQEDKQQEMAEQYLAGTLTTTQAQTAVKSTSGRASSKQAKKWSRGKVAVSASYPRGVRQAELADALEDIAKQLREDGRGRRAA